MAKEPKKAAKAAAEDKKPMISPEYRKAHAKAEPDWLRKFVGEQCYGPEQLPEGSKKKAKIVADVSAMVRLAEANGLDVTRFTTDAYNNGQKIMNINNVLRAAARKRHGLKSLDGSFKKIRPDDPMIAGHEKTENQDGESLKKKVEKKEKVTETA